MLDAQLQRGEGRSWLVGCFGQGFDDSLGVQALQSLEGRGCHSLSEQEIPLDECLREVFRNVIGIVEAVHPVERPHAVLASKLRVSMSDYLFSI